MIANLTTIAAAHKIPIDKLRWYAAFHNTKHHPHIHLVVYSVDPKLGYLTNKGIESMRHAFADTIFHNEMQEVYDQQTDIRNELRQHAKQLFEDSLQDLIKNPKTNPELEILIIRLSEQLKRASGKKVYGYLQPKVKATINQIVEILENDPTIKKMYDEWCELEKAKHETYSSATIQLPSLKDNKVFKPIKNAIINAVLEMNEQITEEIQNEQQSAAIQNVAFDLLNILGRMISDEGDKIIKSPKFHTDKKQRQKDRERKQALGLKDSPEQEIKMY